MPCPFCERIEAGDLTAESEHAVAFPDGFPVAEGHTLIVPRRHEPSFFHLTAEEQTAIPQVTHSLHKPLVYHKQAPLSTVIKGSGLDPPQ